MFVKIHRKKTKKKKRSYLSRAPESRIDGSVPNRITGDELLRFLDRDYAVEFTENRLFI